MEKPFSQACENNKRPILEVLRRQLRAPALVLEIGSGTGQHAVFLGEQLPHLVWQTSDLAEHHAGIRRWLDDAGLANVRPPVALEVTTRPWPVGRADAVFSANTAHIMSWPMVEAFFAGAGEVLASDGLLLLYGPFNYAGVYTSESNARFDASLKARDPSSGLRDFEAVDALAVAAGLRLVEDAAMPANNRLLVWRKASPAPQAASGRAQTRASIAGRSRGSRAGGERRSR
jgi:cyclopropane fatty-acyl-phospholipid synthase-like methyltransferase